MRFHLSSLCLTVQVLGLILSIHAFSLSRRQGIKRLEVPATFSSHMIHRSTINIRPQKTLSLRFKVAESDEEESEMDEDLDFDEVKPGGLVRKLSGSIIPLAATLGFVATPSAALASRLVGAAAGGVAGALTKIIVLDKLVKAAEDADSDGGDDDDGESAMNSGGGKGGSFVSHEVSTLLQRMAGGPPLLGYTVKKLESVAKRANLPEKLLGELFAHLFAEAVYQSVRTPSTDLTELGEVMDLADSLKLTKSEIADGCTIAACKLGRLLKKDKQGFFSNNYPQDFILHSAKLFFLSSKMIGGEGISAKLEGYYGRRMSTALSFFTDEMLNEVVTDASTKLFVRCVDSVLRSPDDFTAEEISKFREFLTTSAHVSALRPANMQSIVMSALKDSLDSVLGTDALTKSMTVTLSNYQTLQKAGEIFEWNPLEFTATLETKTMPIFEVAAKELVEEVLVAPQKAEELSKVLTERVGALNVDIRKARVFLTTLISEKNNEYMVMIDRVYNVSDSAVEPAFKIMATYAATHDALRILTKGVMGDMDIPIPGLPFAEMVRVSMYEMQLAKKDGRISDEMFSLNEEQKNIVRKNLVLPKVAGWIKQCIDEDNFSEDAKAAYEKMLREKGVTEAEWKATAIDFYYQELAAIAKTRAIPSAVDMKRIQDIEMFLSCSPELVEKTNLELLGDKYRKAISESMMPTGVISEEYLEGLDRLRERLGISKADSQKLLGVTARSRMGEVVKTLIDQWKADTGVSKRKDEEKKKDKSRDPISSEDNVLGYMETGANVMETGGPNVFMREALNLVDYVVENYRTQGVNVEAPSELPVTAIGFAKEEELLDVYKHYLVTSLTEQSPDLRSRYVKDEKIFARILGILPESQAKVKESLLYTTYKRMLRKVLLFKDAVEASDLQQFVYLKQSLGIEGEAADRILSESSKGAVLEHTASFMRAKGDSQLITADDARRLRSQIASLGLNIQKDAGFNSKLIAYMYTLEVQDMIENGLEADLQDIQEAYDIPRQQAEAIVEATCKRYVSQLLNIALAAAKKYNEVESVKWTQKLAKYMFFFSDSVDADGNMFSENDKERLITFFRDSENSSSDASQKKEIIARLKSLIHLSDDFIAPVEGLAGLLGLPKTDRKNSGMMM